MAVKTRGCVLAAVVTKPSLEAFWVMQTGCMQPIGPSLFFWVPSVIGAILALQLVN